MTENFKNTGYQAITIFVSRNYTIQQRVEWHTQNTER